jgi:endonuclease III
MKSHNIEEIFRILQKEIPNPITELNYINLYTLLVAVILSAQAKDSAVNIATKNLFLVATTPQQMLNLGEEKLIENIKTIGLYKNKAKNIMLMSQQLIDNHNGQVPDNFEALINLAGVGRKTANVILNVYFKQPTMPVDTHVFRLANRIGLVESNDLLEVENGLLKIIPKQHLLYAHHLLILHGRYTCTAKAPKCEICPIEKVCEKNFITNKN